MAKKDSANPSSAGTATEPESAARRSRSTVDAAGYLAAGLVVATFLLPLARTAVSMSFYVEWPAWLLAIETFGLAIIFLRHGWPAGAAQWALLVVLALVPAGTAGLFALGEFEFLALCTIEIGLRLSVAMGWGIAIGGGCVVFWTLIRRRPWSRQCRWVGKLWFATTLTLLCLEPAAAFLDWNSDRLAFPENLPPPPASEFHVATLGGSTMFGHPYHPKFGIPSVVQWQLEMLCPEARVLVHNLAKSGQNLRQAVGKLGSLKVRPQAILVYSGHNEFLGQVHELHYADPVWYKRADDWLHWSSVFRVFDFHLSQKLVAERVKSAEGRRLMDQPIATPKVMERRRLRFERTLDQLARFCRRNGIEAVWFVPAGAERGYEPNRSIVPRYATDGQRLEVEKIHSEGTLLEREQRWQSAATTYAEGLRLQPRFAEFHYRMAEVLYELERFQQAAHHYRLAQDYDQHPLRITLPYRDAIFRVGRRHGVSLIDAAQVLRPITKHGILDATVFHDNVHPTLDGYLRLGLSAAGELRAIGATRFHCRPVGQTASDLGACLRWCGFGARDLSSAYYWIANDWKWHSPFRFDSTNRIRKAEWFLDRSEGLREGRIRPGESGTETFRDGDARALRQPRANASNTALSDQPEPDLP